MFLRAPEIITGETNYISLLNQLTSEISKLGYFNVPAFPENPPKFSLRLSIPFSSLESAEIFEKELKGEAGYSYKGNIGYHDVKRFCDNDAENVKIHCEKLGFKVASIVVNKKDLVLEVEVC